MLGAACFPCCVWTCYHADDRGPPVNPSNVLVQAPTCYDRGDGLEVRANVCFDGVPAYGCVPDQAYEIALSGHGGSTWTVARVYDGTGTPPLADQVAAGVGQTCQAVQLDYSLAPNPSTLGLHPAALRVRVRARSYSPGAHYLEYSSGVVVQVLSDQTAIYDPRIRWAIPYAESGTPAFTPTVNGIVLDVTMTDGLGCNMAGTVWDWEYCAVPAVFDGEGQPHYPQPLPANPVWNYLTQTGAYGSATRNLSVGGDSKLTLTATAPSNRYDTVYLRLTLVNHPIVFYVERFTNE